MSKTVREPSDTDMPNKTPRRLTQGSDFRLRGKTRLVARGIWVALIAFNVLSFVTGIPDLFATVKQVCPQQCAFVPQQQTALANIGISMNTYARIVVDTLVCRIY